MTHFKALANKSQRSVVLGLLLASWGILATSCGIPESEVEVFASEDHADLLGLEESLPGSESETDARFALYFVGEDGELLKLYREGSRKLGTALKSLTEGPLDKEVAAFGSIETALPTSLSPSANALDPNTKVLRIDVDPEAQLRSEVEQTPARGRLIFSQIVCTVTDMRPDITGIEIFDDATEAITVTDSNGQRIDGPARRSDFDNCQAAPT